MVVVKRKMKKRLMHLGVVEMIKNLHPKIVFVEVLALGMEAGHGSDSRSEAERTGSGASR